MMLMHLAIAIAIQSGISPQLFTAIIMQESSFRNGQVSSTGDLGLGQLSPKTAASMGCIDTNKLRYEPNYNLKCSALYLQYLYGKHGAREPQTWWARYNSNRPSLRVKYAQRVRNRIREISSEHKN